MLHLWTPEKFHSRLAAMRDLYAEAFDVVHQAFQHPGEKVGDEERSEVARTLARDRVREKLAAAPHEDPWKEVGPREVMMRVERFEKGDRPTYSVLRMHF